MELSEWGSETIRHLDGVKRSSRYHGNTRTIKAIVSISLVWTACVTFSPVFVSLCVLTLLDRAFVTHCGPRRFTLKDVFFTTVK
jgi:hypothetical protein